MDIKITDIMMHIDEDLNKAQRDELESFVREQDGVVALGYHDEKPHLMLIEYNPDKVSSSDLLSRVQDRGLHAELVGFI